MKYSKIDCSLAVRRFNAQIELVDLALGDGAAATVTDLGALHQLLCISGHVGLAHSFTEAVRQVCITGSGWPAAREVPPPPAAPGNSFCPPLSPLSLQTKGECKMSADCPNPAWLNADAHLEKERWQIALSRIAFRGRASDESFKDAFEMCQLIAKEALRKV